jgi:hypothetical protein
VSISLRRKRTSRSQAVVAKGSVIAGAVAPRAEKAKETALVYGETAREWAAPHVETAREWATPHVYSARVWAEPHVDSAREWVAPRIELAVDKARTEVAPAVAAAVGAASAATAPVTKEAKLRSDAALQALRGELAPKPKARRTRGGGKPVLLLALLGGLAAAWYAMRKRGSSDPWATDEGGWADGGSATASDTSLSAPVGTAASAAAGATTAAAPAYAGSEAAGSLDADVSDDVAGASPDEALADATDNAGPLPPTDVDAAVGSIPVGTTGGEASEVVDPTDEQVTAEEALRQRDEASADARGLRQFP